MNPMPRTCTVCTHPEKAAIDKALAAGASPSELSVRYSPVERRAFMRHLSSGHVAKELVKAQEHEDVRQALDIVQQLKAINGASLNILKEARAIGANGLALQAVDRVH